MTRPLSSSHCLIGIASLLCSMAALPATAQSLPRYVGTTLSNPNQHDGGLSPIVGVHNIQIMRANREHPTAANGYGWTYNHQPMMAYWHGRFYVHYLCDERDEQVPPSHTMMQTSTDGYRWSTPVVLFPEYQVPDGFTKEGVKGVAHSLTAVMHQRQGFYVSRSGRLYALGTYGVCLDKTDHNNDGNGIGRVIREIKDDGRLGDIYFIYYNHGFGPSNTRYPHWKKADRWLRQAVQEIYANPRMLMGWVEEADRGDTLLPLKTPYKAYCDYTLPDGRIVALWKHALTSVSADGGRTWAQPVKRAQGFVNSNAKIWGQRLSDGTYATVYNPSEFRWPLAISLSADGLTYTTLHLVNGEVPPMRYGGNYKSYGPQYVRGILEGNGQPEDRNLWLTYSMNKEDIWVARVPVPAMTAAPAHADDDFARVGSLSELTQWNIYSPLLAPVSVGGPWLTLTDSDPFDYAKAERKIPASTQLHVSFDLQAAQAHHGTLQIEFLDEHGTACSRLEFTPEGTALCKGGARYGTFMHYKPGQTYRIEADLSVPDRTITLRVDGKQVHKRIFFAPVRHIERIMFRTGARRTFPDVDTPADWDGTLPRAGETDTTAIYRIARFHTESRDADQGAALLHTSDYRHYVDEFNAMDDENIVQAIPDSMAWEWMTRNIPLFDCPQQDFERMYYYRWWTLRKHIRQTDVGYAMTEFLVPRSYADRYNLISSALGHHIHESRWMRNPLYLDQIIRTWYRGNGGQAMKKLDFYSSWTPASIWARYLVDGNREGAVSLLPDLKAEYLRWDDHRWTQAMPTDRAAGLVPRGKASLYWQYDVRDAMEETISGGRREKNARPSINSYMYGNARAIAAIASLCGDQEAQTLYTQKADTLKRLVEQCLWNKESHFFEVLKPDSFAHVREAIGFLPWYFGLPADNAEFARAWLQAADPQGFSAPYGQTTAERRHPLFRTHGVGKCEWDGAVWPFATSQTLTAMANYLNDYRHPVITDSLYFAELEKYVQSQSHRGKPYIGEYLDETTGYWLKGDQERSRYYNHSTFCDLIITGLCGLRPSADDLLTVNPLLPQGRWRYFCIDKIRYHGHDLTIAWDHDGSRYHAGRGLRVYVDGKLRGQRDTLGKLTVSIK